MPERKLIDECVHCGFCLPACPTYNNWNEEMDSPRGRIYLMKSLLEKKIELTDAVRGHFDKCLGCMSCVTACPSGVKYDKLIEDQRAELERQKPRPPADRFFRAMLFSLFPYPARLRALLFFQLLYVKSGLRWLFHKIGVFKLVPRRYAQLERVMPDVGAHHLSARLPVFSAATAPRRGRVALLAGCVQRVYFPGVNEATIRVLNAEGYDVSVPEGQGCCGALSLHVGREDESKALARDMIELFLHDPVDAVIVNSAGCGSHMKTLGRLFRHEEQYAQRAHQFDVLVKDITEFLAGIEPVAKRHPVNVRAAMHDACHLRHAQRIIEQPRKLLRGIPGLTLLDVPDAEQCCGSAGVYNLIEPESAEQIGTRKVDNVLSLSPQLLVSGNPGCTLQIQAKLRDRGLTLPALHPIELLDRSIRGEDSPAV
ncbi:MAG TPA: heterodisulfide reductase-related iron-sulfur binding cluster [Myxococcales bacterium]|nr:heterodisulfide reductase-related iron-sulfur binding cluster [Myxococcales bacterium]